VKKICRVFCSRFIGLFDQPGGLVLLSDLLDPILDVRDPGVDPGIVGLPAPDAPGHNSDLRPRVSGPNLHGAARVAL
jgi:hypothetical protein